jgi:hypothetical protein
VTQLRPQHHRRTRARADDPWLNDSNGIILEAQLLNAAILDTPSLVSRPGTPLTRTVESDDPERSS